MSDETDKETSDVKQLKAQIENLRCAIIILIIFASMIFIYIVIQVVQTYSISFMLNLGLFLIVPFGVLLLCAYSFATDRGGK